jgi:hypothetical protein
MFEFIMRQPTLDCSVGLGPTVFWIRIGSVGLQGMRLSVVIKKKKVKLQIHFISHSRLTCNSEGNRFHHDIASNFVK